MPDLAPPNILVSFGSNIDPEENIFQALVLLDERCGVADVSTVYRTRALDRPDQGDFLNGACRLSDAPQPRALKFDVLLPIEERLGRVRGPDKFAPRTIDLDIALYGDVVLDEPGIAVPDPDIRTRAFLALPLSELAPHAVLPGSGEELQAVAQTFPPKDLESVSEYTDRLKARFAP